MTYAQHKNKPANYKQAKSLRKNASPVELILRKALRVQLKSYDFVFRFQYPIDTYVVDFVCLSARLIIEIDGMSHDASVRQDLERQAYLEKQGFHVERFANSDVVKDPVAIAMTICERAKELIASRKKTLS